MDENSELVDDPEPTSSSEPDDLGAIEQRMIALAKTKPKGISDKDISMEMPDLEPLQKAQIVNKLLSRGYIDLFKQGGSLLYRLKDPNKGKAVKGADNEEKIVYSIIEDAGSKGIWIRDIRFKSNLMLTQLNKILKNLETKKLIKAVKSVAASKKKVYMLYNLEPDRTITGGAWYQDQDFEAEFVDVLNQQCFRFLDQKREDNKDCRLGPIDARNSTFASSKEVWKFISDLGISKVKLSVEDLEMILNTLVYDGKVERILSSDGNNLYRAIQPMLSPPGLIKTPCGVCPVRKNCCDVGDVSPIKCQYITECEPAYEYTNEN
ncbi:probable DNA-directed RNA polymerase III subunit RPC6 isoform X2 [Venturia canescens]|uniref:probable DNA-directed RNA polymerase III subunit RPC6 isoform X2 n=1 Tax=Venturia canescens TaxID=32260 RepID=UPI001C9CF0BC|nr:probable DNA-directed RNA polymerase III subunit RPC6 isoform X2 [Venturia canescens]